MSTKGVNDCKWLYVKLLFKTTMPDACTAVDVIEYMQLHLAQNKCAYSSDLRDTLRD